MSYYVQRTSKNNPAGIAYVGPIRSLAQAEREQNAWEDAGETTALFDSSDSVKAEVRRWQKITHAADAREIVTYRGEQMTLARYRFEFEEVT